MKSVWDSLWHSLRHTFGHLSIFLPLYEQKLLQISRHPRPVIRLLGFGNLVSDLLGVLGVEVKSVELLADGRIAVSLILEDQEYYLLLVSDISALEAEFAKGWCYGKRQAVSLQNELVLGLGQPMQSGQAAEVFRPLRPLLGVEELGDFGEVCLEFHIEPQGLRLLPEYYPVLTANELFCLPWRQWASHGYLSWFLTDLLFCSQQNEEVCRMLGDMTTALIDWEHFWHQHQTNVHSHLQERPSLQQKLDPVQMKLRFALLDLCCELPREVPDLAWLHATRPFVRIARSDFSDESCVQDVYAALVELLGPDAFSTMILLLLKHRPNLQEPQRLDMELNRLCTMERAFASFLVDMPMKLTPTQYAQGLSAWLQGQLGTKAQLADLLEKKAPPKRG